MPKSASFQWSRRSKYFPFSNFSSNFSVSSFQRMYFSFKEYNWGKINFQELWYWLINSLCSMQYKIVLLIQTASSCNPNTNRKFVCGFCFWYRQRIFWLLLLLQLWHARKCLCFCSCIYNIKSAGVELSCLLPVRANSQS